MSDERDDLVAYALGALDAEARRTVEARLGASPEVARDVHEFEEVAALLAYAAPAVAVPAGLRERILADARAVRPIGTARAAVAKDTAAAGRPWRTVVPWLAAAASLLGMLYVNNQLGTEREARQVADQTASSLRGEVASLDSVVSTLLAPDVLTVALSATGQPPTARLFWNARQRRVVFAAYQLPPAARGRTYQLWGIAEGTAPVSLGTFNTKENGEVRATFSVPEGVDIAVGAVTEEPEGGSPQPTSTPFLVGQFKVATD
ncbi:MAG: anti-sigma factor [Gemmatimonadaceae bacterium]